ncbi:Hypothetical protein MBVG_2640 [Mycoplasmopsis bovigenitalium 51080]|uniref:Uncharacterized protein n=1 Tax=Mycoplasmopsis bovigenitalium 51080 TaxID=1188235 RepID=N9TUU9_9BACT|nr:hypothetical protein [Mycoplasmopsis bovigenitalium]ENY69894.1 Hypothetical protein MBVG_2640 [Mycoplasmopsis bovigenitalium 51080]
MNKIYTYGIITDTDKPQLYEKEFWDNVGLHYAVKREDIGKYMREKAEIDKEYFVFALNKANLSGLSYYIVDRTQNNGIDVVKQIGDKLFITNKGVYALKKSDFDNDLEKAEDFADQEMRYLYDLLNTQFNEVQFSAYEYDQEKQKYVKTNDFINEKLIKEQDLQEIMQEKDLTLKEKLIKIVRNENILDYDKLDEYDFLQDTNSIVMSEKALLDLPQELHSFIDKGLSEREKKLEKEPEEKPLNSQDYWIVEGNETWTDIGVKSYRGKLLTKELVDELKKLDEWVSKHEECFEDEDGALKAEPIGYFKFYFDHIQNGEITQHLRIDIGNGNEVNEKNFQFLYEEVNKANIAENNQEDKSEQEKEQQVKKQAKGLRM